MVATGNSPSEYRGSRSVLETSSEWLAVRYGRGGGRPEGFRTCSCVRAHAVFVKQQIQQKCKVKPSIAGEGNSHAIAGGVTRLHQAEPFSAAKLLEAPRRFLLFQSAAAFVPFFPSFPSRHPISYLRHIKGRHARVAPRSPEYPPSSGKLDLVRDFATRDQATLPAALDLGPSYSSHCLQAWTSTCRVRSLSCSTNT